MTDPSHHHTNDPIEHIWVHEDMTVDELVRGMGGTAFNARRLSMATDVLEDMLRDEECTRFMGLAGAMVPAGMRHLVAQMIRDEYVDILVSTGANLVHDLVESLGLNHHRGSCEADDHELLKEHITRIYDVFLPEEHFTPLEEFMQETLMEVDGPLSIRELLTHIGSRIEDPDSILRSAYEMDVPIYCPAIQDSIIGLQAWLYKQTRDLHVDTFDDMREFMDTCFESKRTGAIMIGGGVPKNYVLQSMLVMPKGGFDYAVQVTTDRPDSGGLSGATLDEAISWGKLGERARAVTVYADATIALPLMLASVKSRLAQPSP